MARRSDAIHRKQFLNTLLVDEPLKWQTESCTDSCQAKSGSIPKMRPLQTSGSVTRRPHHAALARLAGEDALAVFLRAGERDAADRHFEVFFDLFFDLRGAVSVREGEAAVDFGFVGILRGEEGVELSSKYLVDHI